MSRPAPPPTIAVSASPKDDPAVARWEKTLAENPADEHAAAKLSEALIRAGRRRFGLSDGAAEDEPSRNDRGTTLVPAQQLNDRSGVGRLERDISVTQIQQLEVAINQQPTRTDLYLELAQLYLDKGRDYEAERLLARGKDATDKDPAVLRLHEDVTMMRFEKKVSAAKRDLEIEPTPQAQAALDQVLKDRDRAETEIYQARCKREPHNLALRYGLGLRLKRAGKPHEARKAFEDALQDEASRCLAAFELGDTLEQAHAVPDALRYYRAAADSALRREHHDCRRQALLRAGKLAAKAKLYKLARRYLRWLLRVDPSNQAAAAQLEKVEVLCSSSE